MKQPHIVEYNGFVQSDNFNSVQIFSAKVREFLDEYSASIVLQLRPGDSSKHLAVLTRLDEDTVLLSVPSNSMNRGFCIAFCPRFRLTPDTLKEKTSGCSLHDLYFWTAVVNEIFEFEQRYYDWQKAQVTPGLVI